MERHELMDKIEEIQDKNHNGRELFGVLTRPTNSNGVIARYSLPEDFEERLARYLELACILKEDGLKPDDYDEYCELREEIEDEYF